MIKLSVASVNEIKSSALAVVRNLKYPLLLSVIAILFIDALTRVCIDYVANPILSSFTSSKLADVIFFASVVWVLGAFAYRLWQRYYVRTEQFILYLIIIAFYIFFRFLHIPHLFRSLVYFDSIKYSDVLLVLLGSPVILKFCSLVHWRRGSNTANSALRLSAVKPIDNKFQDILGRASRASRFAAEVKEFTTEESLAVGIVGEWGSGKTSFINMVKESFKECDRNEILIDFNPWLNISVDTIIEDYFKTLEKALEGYSLDIARTIKRYADTVLGLHKNDITDTLLKSSDLLLDVSLNERFERLNALLKKIGRRVYIFIDDFDRLQSDEVFETLKLIRNTAGFDAITYIVAYDREYLIKSLEQHGIPKPAAFSEKIFQMEIELLPATRQQINEVIIKKLVAWYPRKEADIREFLEGQNNRFAPIECVKDVTSPLKHIRDVERFMNIFAAEYSNVIDEVYLRDYFILKLIKFRYSAVYNLLFSYKDDFLHVEDYQSSQGKSPKYKLNRVNEKDHGYGSMYYDVFGGSVLEAYLTSANFYAELQLKEIRTLINNLFFQETHKDTLSISYETNYYKYFKDELGKGNLSVQEFQRVMHGPGDKIADAVSNWFAEGKIDNAAFLLAEVKVLDLPDRKAYENLIAAMFAIGRLPKENYLGGEGFYNFDNGTLCWNIDDARGMIAERFYEGDSEALETFVESFFKNAESPFLFESSLLHFMERYGRGYTAKTFSREKHHAYCVHYFKSYCEGIDSIDNNFWHLFHNSKIASYKEAGDNTYVSYIAADGIKEAVMEFTLRNLDAVLVRFISDTTPYGRSDGKVTGVSSQISELFGSVEKLLQFLQSEGEDSGIARASQFREEFIDYLTKLIENNAMINYPFIFPAAVERVQYLKSTHSRD